MKKTSYINDVIESLEFLYLHYEIKRIKKKNKVISKDLIELLKLYSCELKILIDEIEKESK